MNKANEALKAVAQTLSQNTSNVASTPYATGMTGVPTTLNTTLGHDYGQLLNQYQQLQQAYPGMSQPQAQLKQPLPSREHIKKRLAETQQLLDLLKEVDRILQLHPDLERLIGTLARLGQL